MQVAFSPAALEHWKFWQKTSPAIVNRIQTLLKDIAEHPFSGIGKPEPLKHEFAGMWSRRINEEHRLVYSIENDRITIFVLSMRYHYRK